MPTIDLPHGTVSYRVTGPAEAAAPPVVFVHGFLVSSTLWSTTADALAEAGVRAYAADWPLGSHTIALGEQPTSRLVAWRARSARSWRRSGCRT